MFFKKYLKEIFLSVIIILILCLYVVLYYQKKDNFDNSFSVELESTLDEEDNLILEENVDYYVEIKGAVKHPGVYHVLLSNIINDVIDMAGGLLDNAYTDNINLSKKVKDEMVIYIYTEKQYKNLNKKEIVYVYETCNCSNVDISNCVNDGSSVITSSDSTESEESTEQIETNSLININTASKDELIKLSGIGEAKANKIIDYRTTNGDFKETHDIVNVSGISEAIYDKIKDYITV